MAENNVEQNTETSVNNTPNDASNIENKQDNTTSNATVDGSSSKPANKFSGQSRLCLGGRFTPDEISKVKLKKSKKSKAQKKKEQTKFAKQLCETSDDYYKLVKETYFENYYNSIKELTFPTDYIDLNKNHCKVLMGIYNKYKNSQNNGEFKYDDNELKDLVDSIDKIKKDNKWKYIFVRMSIRSPKDAALDSNKFVNIINREYASLQNEYGKSPPNDMKINGKLKGINRQKLWELNQKIIACYRGQTFALACKSGKECIDLLVKSKRIQGDMESYLDGTYKQKFQLCIRKFQFFDVSYEFRTFIYNKKVTGITQYNDLCYFSDLVKYKDDIKQKIITFIDSIKDKISLNNFVLDIVMIDDNDNSDTHIWKSLTKDKLNKLSIMIIEINPLAEFAGGGLFEWNKDKDILLGDKPSQFRIQTKLSSYVAADLMPEWKAFIFGKTITNNDNNDDIKDNNESKDDGNN